MALQHIRAFRARREEFGDQINQDIAHTIADHMGYDDSPATVSIKTLATEARVHYNTADKRTKEMAAAGLIKIEKQGKLLCYSIPGKYDDDTRTIAEPANSNDDIERLNGRMDTLEKKVDQLCEDVRRLSHDLHIIVTASSHDVHTSLTPPVNENVNEVEKGRSREEVKTPPNPPAQNDGPETELPEPFKPKYLRFIPVTLQDNKLIDAWASWEEYRITQGNFTEMSAKRQLKELGEWGLDRAIAAINHSIKQGYKGIYEPNGAKTNGHHPNQLPAPSQGLVEITPGSGRY